MVLHAKVCGRIGQLPALNQKATLRINERGLFSFDPVCCGADTPVRCRWLLVVAFGVGVGLLVLAKWPLDSLSTALHVREKIKTPTSRSKAADKSVRPTQVYIWQTPISHQLVLGTKPPGSARTGFCRHFTQASLPKLSSGPQHMVERLILPNRTGTAEQIDLRSDWPKPPWISFKMDGQKVRANPLRVANMGVISMCTWSGITTTAWKKG